MSELVPPMEMSIIKNMMLRRPYKEIAEALGITVSQVGEAVLHLKGSNDLETAQDRIDVKVAQRKAMAGKHQRERGSRAIRKETKKKPVIITRQIQSKDVAYVERKGFLETRKNYRNRDVDYSQLITVRIDRKTVIYAKPGDDIEKLKHDFLKTYSKSFNKPGSNG